jgi:hypothetical protein
MIVWFLIGLAVVVGVLWSWAKCMDRYHDDVDRDFAAMQRRGRD